MGVIRDMATDSVSKLSSVRTTEFLFSPQGRQLVADALILYHNKHPLDSVDREQISEMLDNIFDVWHERRLKLDSYR